MRVSKIHWTWYMYAGIPDPIVRTNKSLSKVPRKKNRKVEKTSEI